jgi:hypothetical protein
MHLLYGDFFALYKFNNQSINQSEVQASKKMHATAHFDCLVAIV